MYKGSRNLSYIKQATGIQNLDSAAYLGQMVYVPERDVQGQIARRMDATIDAIDEIRTKILNQRSVIVERRQALVTAAVTGEIDVSTARGVSA